MRDEFAVEYAPSAVGRFFQELSFMWIDGNLVLPVLLLGTVGIMAFLLAMSLKSERS